MAVHPIPLIGCTLLFFAASCASSAPEDRFDPTAFVETDEGDAPLVIAVPHDGTRSASLPYRKSGQGFSIDQDIATSLLAVAIAYEYATLSGQKPTIAVNRLHRIYVDMNRTEAEAASSAEALMVYRAYHLKIRLLVDRLKRIHSKIAFLDLHSQATYPADLMTTAHATRRFRMKLSLDRYSVYSLSSSARTDFLEHTCLLPCNLPIEPVPSRLLDGFTAQSVREANVDSM